MSRMDAFMNHLLNEQAGKSRSYKEGKNDGLLEAYKHVITVIMEHEDRKPFERLMNDIAYAVEMRLAGRTVSHRKPAAEETSITNMTAEEFWRHTMRG